MFHEINKVHYITTKKIIIQKKRKWTESKTVILFVFPVYKLKIKKDNWQANKKTRKNIIRKDNSNKTNCTHFLSRWYKQEYLRQHLKNVKPVLYEEKNIHYRVPSTKKKNLIQRIKVIQQKNKNTSKQPKKKSMMIN